jgi:autotransporter adhesin
VALGAGSTTTADLTAAGYNPGSGALSGTASAANGEVSVGSAGKERRVTNVAAGSAATDAVNVSQLQSEAGKSNAIGAATAAALGGGSTYDSATGAISAPSYSVGGTTVRSVSDAVTNLDDRVTTNTTDITKLQNQMGDVGTQLSGVMQYDRNADGSVNFGSVTLGGGQSAGPVILTNVANGTSQYDAVNFGQLSDLQNQVTDLNGQVQNLSSQASNIQPGSPYVDATDVPSSDSSDGAVINAALPGSGAGSTAAGAGAVASGNSATAIGANANAAADNAVAVGANAAATGVNSTAMGTGSQATGTNSVALGQGSVADRDNSVSVGSAGNERQITNVAAGTAPTDAVNVGQLNSVRSDMDTFRKDAMGGVASAMALANLPQSVLPGRVMVGMGGSTYGGQVGAALGVSYMTRDSKWTVKAAAASSTRAEIGAALSAGFYW